MGTVNVSYFFLFGFAAVVIGISYVIGHYFGTQSKTLSYRLVDTVYRSADAVVEKAKKELKDHILEVSMLAETFRVRMTEALWRTKALENTVSEYISKLHQADFEFDNAKSSPEHVKRACTLVSMRSALNELLLFRNTVRNEIEIEQQVSN